MSKIAEVFILCAVALSFSGVVQAQTAAEMLQKFQQLPPNQQQQLMDRAQQAQADGQVPAGLTGSTLPESVPQGAPVVEQTVVTPLPPAAADKTKENVELADGAANEKTASGLRPFGYDLFAGAPTTFAPATDIPIPHEYIVGPGDVLEVQLFGKQNMKYSLTVQRDGAVTFPELGPIQVAGLQFDNMREMLQQQITKRLIGVQSSVTLGQLRSIRVFVLGDARRPGSYTVSALSTITNALFVSGGISETGSLRRIQLKRRGQVVNSLDLYDLLLQGDTSRDTRLEPGDVIFVPPVGATVGVSGEVRRPAIYEINGKTTALDVVTLAGGLLSTSAPTEARLDRIDDDNTKVVVDLDLAAAGRNLPVRNGDVLRIPSVLDRIEGVVFLHGHVYRPESVKWRPGLRVRDVLPRAEVMKPLPDLDFGLIVREDPQVKTISVLPFSPRQVFDGAEGSNIALQSRDAVYVFGLGSERTEQVMPVLDTLALQARKTGRAEIVSVLGQVYVPGQYPLFAGMQVSDLLKAAVGITPDADRDYAVLVREDATTGDTHILTVNLRELMADGTADADFPLEAKDQLLIFGAREARDELLKLTLERLRAQARLNQPAAVVRVTGDVRFPGTYPLTGGMTAMDLIGVAGGLAEPAYALSAELSRATADQATGYLVKPVTIDLAKELTGETSFALQADDTLMIKRLPNYREAAIVTLEGEFLFPGDYRIQEGETLSQLVKRAGGLSPAAYANATTFVRESLRKSEGERLKVQKQQLEKDLVRLQLETAKSDDKDTQIGALKVAQLADQLSETQAVGRMVINLPRVLKDDEDYDVRLEHGDKLVVGRKPQAVSVFGEVLFPTSHQYQRGENAFDYINRSGGTTQTADKKRAYIVRANGEVIAHAGSSWLLAPPTQPGDTIVVPYDATGLDKLKLTTNIVQIVSQLAITAASMKSIGAF